MSDSNPYSYDYDPNASDIHEQPVRHSPADLDYQQVTYNYDYDKNNDMSTQDLQSNVREPEATEVLPSPAEYLGPTAASQQLPKNWPICYPIIRHKIIGDIEPGLKRATAIMAHAGWFIFMLVVILNFACAIATVVLSYKTKNKVFQPVDRVKILLFSAFFVIGGIPGHLIVSYFPVYFYLKQVNLPRFILFAIGYFVALLFTAFGIVGWTEYGPCGVIGAIRFAPVKGKGSIAAFVINLIMGLIWCSMFLYFLLIAIICLKFFFSESSAGRASLSLANKLRRRTTANEPDSTYTPPTV